MTWANKNGSYRENQLHMDVSL